MKKRKKMTVARIKVEDDRILFYSDNPGMLDYHVISDRTRAAIKVKEGDEIIYEPYGMNFGWFEEKVEK